MKNLLKPKYRAGAYYSPWQRRWIPAVYNGTDVLYYGPPEESKKKAVRKARRVRREIVRRERRFGKHIVIEE